MLAESKEGEEEKEEKMQEKKHEGVLFFSSRISMPTRVQSECAPNLENIRTGTSRNSSQRQDGDDDEAAKIGHWLLTAS